MGRIGLQVPGHHAEWTPRAAAFLLVRAPVAGERCIYPQNQVAHAQVTATSRRAPRVPLGRGGKLWLPFVATFNPTGARMREAFGSPQ